MTTPSPQFCKTLFDGYKMGQPVFELEEIIKEHNIQLFSSNYSLYADLSKRVMNVIADLCPRVEVYSIDEAFAELTEFPPDDLTEFVKTLKARVYQHTGLP